MDVPGSVVPNRPRRIRVSIATTVHPDTVTRLDYLTEHFRLGRGQIFDKLVLALHVAISQGKLTCVNGEVCRMGRTDVPPVL